MSCARRPTITALVALALAAAACGGDDPDEASTTRPVATTAVGAGAGGSPAGSPACEAVPKQEVERVIRSAGGRAQPLERTANDSLDLSICEYRERSGSDLFVEITIDSASHAAERYSILIEEGRQRATFDAIPDSSKPIGVRGIGDDRVNGGVGAFWVRLTSQLTAVDHGRIVKVRFHVARVGDEPARAAAAALAGAALEG